MSFPADDGLIHKYGRNAVFFKLRAKTSPVSPMNVAVRSDRLDEFQPFRNAPTIARCQSATNVEALDGGNPRAANVGIGNRERSDDRLCRQADHSQSRPFFDVVKTRWLRSHLSALLGDAKQSKSRRTRPEKVAGCFGRTENFRISSVISPKNTRGRAKKTPRRPPCGGLRGKDLRRRRDHVFAGQQVEGGVHIGRQPA